MDFMEWFVRVFACETCMEFYGLLVPKKKTVTEITQLKEVLLYFM